MSHRGRRIYEWRKLERTKQPYFIALKDGEPFAFGGLWEHWAREDQSIDSCAIIVTEAHQLTKAIHDPPERMCAYPVDTAVNDPKNDKPELITEARSNPL
jgi:putative SOS response-associated peptidase YedK